MSPSGAYFAMKSRQSLTPRSSLQVGSIGSFAKAVEMMPVPASSPATSITDEIQIETLLRNLVGFHPISWAFRIACAANFGVAAIRKTSASDAFPDDLGIDGRF